MVSGIWRRRFVGDILGDSARHGEALLSFCGSRGHIQSVSGIGPKARMKHVDFNLTHSQERVGGDLVGLEAVSSMDLFSDILAGTSSTIVSTSC